MQSIAVQGSDTDINSEKCVMDLEAMLSELPSAALRAIMRAIDATRAWPCNVDAWQTASTFYLHIEAREGSCLKREDGIIRAEYKQLYDACNICEDLADEGADWRR